MMNVPNDGRIGSVPPVVHSQPNMNENQAMAVEGLEAMLDVSEVAKFLKISELTVYRLVERRVLPVYRVCRRLRFAVSDVMAYLERNKYDAPERNTHVRSTD